MGYISSNRARLIGAAGSVIGRKGYDAVSLDDVAAGAGLTKGAIYSQFESKRAVIVAVIEQWADECRRALARSPDPAQSVAGFISLGPRARGRQRLLAELWRIALEDDEIRLALDGAYAALRTALRDGLVGRVPAQALDQAVEGIIRLHDGLAVLVALRDPRLESLSQPELTAAVRSLIDQPTGLRQATLLQS